MKHRISGVVSLQKEDFQITTQQAFSVIPHHSLRFQINVPGDATFWLLIPESDFKLKRFYLSPGDNPLSLRFIRNLIISFVMPSIYIFNLNILLFLFRKHTTV